MFKKKKKKPGTLQSKFNITEINGFSTNFKGKGAVTGSLNKKVITLQMICASGERIPLEKLKHVQFLEMRKHWRKPSEIGKFVFFSAFPVLNELMETIEGPNKEEYTSLLDAFKAGDIDTDLDFNNFSNTVSANSAGFPTAIVIAATLGSGTRMASSFTSKRRVQVELEFAAGEIMVMKLSENITAILIGIAEYNRLMARIKSANGVKHK